MIDITVCGDTYPMRKALREAGFHWDSHTQTWSQRVGEGSLDKTINAIRPDVSWSDKECPQLFAILREVSVLGAPLRKGNVKIKIEERATEECILDFFHKEMDSVMQISPVSTPPAPSKKRKEEPKNVDDAFF